MNILKSVVYGVTGFAFMFLFGSILVYRMNLGIVRAEVPMYIFLGLVMFVLALKYEIPSAGEGLRVGLTWLAVYLLLDIFLTVPTYNSGSLAYFYNWRLYVYYSIIVLVPALVGLIKRA